MITSTKKVVDTFKEVFKNIDFKTGDKVNIIPIDTTINELNRFEKTGENIDIFVTPEELMEMKKIKSEFTGRYAQLFRITNYMLEGNSVETMFIRNEIDTMKNINDVAQSYAKDRITNDTIALIDRMESINVEGSEIASDTTERLRDMLSQLSISDIEISFKDNQKPSQDHRMGRPADMGTARKILADVYGVDDSNEMEASYNR